MHWTLTAVRAVARTVDPEARVSTRGMAQGSFSVRTDNRTAMQNALKQAGLAVSPHYEVEGSQWDWVYVLVAYDAQRPRT